MNRCLRSAALVLVLAACEPKWDLTLSEDRLVRRWLLCEECTNGELDSVIALGKRGEAAMEHALRYGPTRKRRDNMRRQAEAMYARIPSPAPVSRQRYVDRYVSNYATTYSSRAIVALRRFNTPSARAALVGAIRPDTRYRYDVRRLLGEAVGTSLLKVAGDTQHAPVDSVVRTNPTILVRATMTGQVLSNVRAVFRVDSGGGTISDSVRLTDPNGKASVQWRLGPTESVNVLRATAAGQMVRFRARGHPPGLRIVFSAQPSDVRAFQSIGPVRLAIQDAWGVTQTGLNTNAQVSIEPAGINSMQNVVGGVADLSGLRAGGPGNGFRLTARILNLPPASSAPFDVAP